MTLYIMFTLVQVLLELSGSRISSADILCRTIEFVIRIFENTSLLITSAIGIDRVLSLRYAMDHQNWTNGRRLRFYATILYIFGISTASSVFTANADEKAVCSMYLSDDVDWTTLSVALLCCVINISSFSGVGVYALMKSNTGRYRTAFSHSLQVTLKAFSITMLFTLFVLPTYMLIILIHVGGENSAIFEDAMDISASLATLGYISLPIILLATYQESRYLVATTLCCCSRKLQSKLKRKYNSHYSTYNIAVITGTSVGPKS